MSSKPPQDNPELETIITGTEKKEPPATAFNDMATQLDSDSSTSTENSSRKRKLPEQIGRYRIISFLGGGGMGDTYLAHDPNTDRRVTIKTLRSDANESDKRFMEEVRATAQLDDPGIVKVFEVHADDEIPHYSMEYVSGESLESLVKREGKLPAKRAAKIIKQIAESLHHAHERGIIHRDIKPANILIDNNGMPKIIDFGLAKRLNIEDLHLTKTGDVFGTPAYMSPEQAAGKNQTIDGRTDIYSLGCIFYRLIAGREPLTADTAINLLKKVLNENPLRPERLTPNLPSDESAICLKALEKLPRHRYATSGEFAEDLGRFLDGRPTLAQPVGLIGNFHRYSIRNRKRLAKLSCMVIACMAILGYTANTFAYRNRLSVLREQEGLPMEQGDKYPLGFLIKALDESEPETRTVALTGLSFHESDRATNAMLKATKDKEVAVRLHLANLTGRLPSGKLEKFLRILCQDESHFVRAKALAVIADRMPPGLESEIIANLQHDNEWVRSPARRALAMVVDRAKGEAAVRKILADPKTPTEIRLGLLQGMTSAMFPPD